MIKQKTAQIVKKLKIWMTLIFNQYKSPTNAILLSRFKKLIRKSKRVGSVHFLTICRLYRSKNIRNSTKTQTSADFWNLVNLDLQANIPPPQIDLETKTPTYSPVTKIFKKQKYEFTKINSEVKF